MSLEDARVRASTHTANAEIEGTPLRPWQEQMTAAAGGALLVVKSVAMSALAGATIRSFGVPFRDFLPAVVLGGLTVYTVEAFAGRWDNSQRIAALLALPAATAASSVLGPIGVAALMVAAGSYGPALFARAIRRIW